MMITSIFIAKILGLYLVITCLFSIVRYQYVEDLLTSLKNENQRGIVFLFALMPIIFGLLLVASHNIWVADWRVLITILAWIMLLSGIYRLFFQDTWVKKTQWWLDYKGFSLTLTVIFFLVGCYLTYKGFTTHPVLNLMINT